jgi:hypothetical protein
MSFRSSSARQNCKLETAFCCLTLVLWLSLGSWASGEPVMILEPHFYRTPVSLPIAGTSRTVIAFYDEATDGSVTAISTASLAEHPVADLQRLALDHARSLLSHVTWKISRDKHGVAVDVRIESNDPSLSSLVLLPGFFDRFADILGKDCLVSIPNRQVIFLFPRLGNDVNDFAYALRSFYHNSPRPVSTELFEWKNGALSVARDLESER